MFRYNAARRAHFGGGAALQKAKVLIHAHLREIKTVITAALQLLLMLDWNLSSADGRQCVGSENAASIRQRCG